MFYLNLAKNNIKKSRQTYLPYAIISTFMVAIFYIMISISQNKSINEYSTTVCIILIWGAAITGIFTVIFLFYINSFLMKKRKTEFGLYNVLGLNKFHIIKVIFFEKLILSIITITTGIILGVIFEKLLFLLLLNIMDVKNLLGFSFVYQVAIATASFFLILNLLMFLWDAFEVKRSKTIELLNSKNYAEKEPKVKVIFTIVGAICLGLGYYNSVTLKDPISSLNVFFVSVILVMIGTYALFITGSIAILKFLKSRKSIYYKTNNFISISIMLYRMKKNAVGLANICILSTAVIIAVSTTLSLYIGSDKYFNASYTGDINISLRYVNQDQIAMVDKHIETLDIKKDSILSSVTESRMVKIDKNKFTPLEMGTLGDAMLVKIPISEYNKMLKKDVKLKENQALLYAKDGYDYNNIYINNKKYNVEKVDKIGRFDEGQLMKTYIMVVDDSEFKDNLMCMLTFDVANKADSEKIGQDMQKYLHESGIKYYQLTEKTVAKKDFDALYGGMLFIGMLIGVVFLVATILIMYYKQITEGQDDKERFEIMKKVGLDDREIKRTIKKQTSIVFLSPVIVASIHLLFAYPTVEKILYMLNLRDEQLFKMIMIGTVVVFIIVYMIVYLITSKVYYKIVK